MFFEELIPLGKELVQQPLAFLGGLCAGALHLNLKDDPLKSWLDQESQGGSNNDRNHAGPKSIAIE